MRKHLTYLKDGSKAVDEDMLEVTLQLLHIDCQSVNQLSRLVRIEKGNVLFQKVAEKC